MTIFGILLIIGCTSDREKIIENYLVSSEDQDELVLEIHPSNLGSYCQAKEERPPLTDEKSLASDKVLIQRVNALNAMNSALETLIKENEWEHTSFAPELVDRKNEVLKKDGRTITSGL